MRSGGKVVGTPLAGAAATAAQNFSNRNSKSGTPVPDDSSVGSDSSQKSVRSRSNAVVNTSRRPPMGKSPVLMASASAASGVQQSGQKMAVSQSEPVFTPVSAASSKKAPPQSTTPAQPKRKIPVVLFSSQSLKAEKGKKYREELETIKDSLGQVSDVAKKAKESLSFRVVGFDSELFDQYREEVTGGFAVKKRNGKDVRIGGKLVYVPTKTRFTDKTKAVLTKLETTDTYEDLEKLVSEDKLLKVFLERFVTENFFTRPPNDVPFAFLKYAFQVEMSLVQYQASRLENNVRNFGEGSAVDKMQKETEKLKKEISQLEKDVAELKRAENKADELTRKDKKLTDKRKELKGELGKIEMNLESSKDKALKFFEADKESYQQSLENGLKHPADVFALQLETLSGGGELNYALTDPSSRPFESKLGVTIEGALSEMQVATLESFEKSVSRRGGGKTEVRVGTGGGKTYLSRIIEKHYGKDGKNYFGEVLTLDLNSSDAEREAVFKAKNLSGKLIQIDESYFFGRFFESRGLVDAEKDRNQLIKSLCDKGAKVITFGASESPEKINIEITRINDKVKALERRLRICNEVGVVEEARKVIKEMNNAETWKSQNPWNVHYDYKVPTDRNGEPRLALKDMKTHARHVLTLVELISESAKSSTEVGVLRQKLDSLKEKKVTPQDNKEIFGYLENVLKKYEPQISEIITFDDDLQNKDTSFEIIRLKTKLAAKERQYADLIERRDAKTKEKFDASIFEVDQSRSPDLHEMTKNNLPGGRSWSNKMAAGEKVQYVIPEFVINEQSCSNASLQNIASDSGADIVIVPHKNEQGKLVARIFKAETNEVTIAPVGDEINNVLGNLTGKKVISFFGAIDQSQRGNAIGGDYGVASLGVTHHVIDNYSPDPGYLPDKNRLMQYYGRVRQAADQIQYKMVARNNNAAKEREGFWSEVEKRTDTESKAHAIGYLKAKLARAERLNLRDETKRYEAYLANFEGINEKAKLEKKMTVRDLADKNKEESLKEENGVGVEDDSSQSVSDSENSQSPQVEELPKELTLFEKVQRLVSLKGGPYQLEKKGIVYSVHINEYSLIADCVELTFVNKEKHTQYIRKIMKDGRVLGIVDGRDNQEVSEKKFTDVKRDVETLYSNMYPAPNPDSQKTGNNSEPEVASKSNKESEMKLYQMAQELARYFAAKQEKTPNEMLGIELGVKILARQKDQDGPIEFEYLMGGIIASCLITSDGRVQDVRNTNEAKVLADVASIYSMAKRDPNFKYKQLVTAVPAKGAAAVSRAIPEEAMFVRGTVAQKVVAARRAEQQSGLIPEINHSSQSVPVPFPDSVFTKAQNTASFPALPDAVVENKKGMGDRAGSESSLGRSSLVDGAWLDEDAMRDAAQKARDRKKRANQRSIVGDGLAQPDGNHFPRKGFLRRDSSRPGTAAPESESIENTPVKGRGQVEDPDSDEDVLFGDDLSVDDLYSDPDSDQGQEEHFAYEQEVVEITATADQIAALKWCKNKGEGGAVVNVESAIFLREVESGVYDIKSTGFDPIKFGWDYKEKISFVGDAEQPAEVSHWRQEVGFYLEKIVELHKEELERDKPKGTAAKGSQDTSGWNKEGENPGRGANTSGVVEDPRTFKAAQEAREIADVRLLEQEAKKLLEKTEAKKLGLVELGEGQIVVEDNGLDPADITFFYQEKEYSFVENEKGGVSFKGENSNSKEALDAINALNALWDARTQNSSPAQSEKSSAQQEDLSEQIQELERKATSLFGKVKSRRVEDYYFESNDWSIFGSTKGDVCFSDDKAGATCDFLLGEDGSELKFAPEKSPKDRTQLKKAAKIIDGLTAAVVAEQEQQEQGKMAKKDGAARPKVPQPSTAESYHPKPGASNLPTAGRQPGDVTDVESFELPTGNKKVAKMPQPTTAEHNYLNPKALPTAKSSLPRPFAADGGVSDVKPIVVAPPKPKVLDAYRTAPVPKNEDQMSVDSAEEEHDALNSHHGGSSFAPVANQVGKLYSRVQNLVTVLGRERMLSDSNGGWKKYVIAGSNSKIWTREGSQDVILDTMSPEGEMLRYVISGTEITLKRGEEYLQLNQNDLISESGLLIEQFEKEVSNRFLKRAQALRDSLGEAMLEKVQHLDHQGKIEDTTEEFSFDNRRIGFSTTYKDYEFSEGDHRFLVGKRGIDEQERTEDEWTSLDDGKDDILIRTSDRIELFEIEIGQKIAENRIFQRAKKLRDGIEQSLDLYGQKNVSETVGRMKFDRGAGGIIVFSGVSPANRQQYSKSGGKDDYYLLTPGKPVLIQHFVSGKSPAKVNENDIGALTRILDEVEKEEERYAEYVKSIYERSSKLINTLRNGRKLKRREYTKGGEEEYYESGDGSTAPVRKISVLPTTSEMPKYTDVELLLIEGGVEHRFLVESNRVKEERFSDENGWKTLNGRREDILKRANERIGDFEKELNKKVSPPAAKAPTALTEAAKGKTNQAGGSGPVQSDRVPTEADRESTQGGGGSQESGVAPIPGTQPDQAVTRSKVKRSPRPNGDASFNGPKIDPKTVSKNVEEEAKEPLYEDETQTLATPPKISPAKNLKDQFDNFCANEIGGVNKHADILARVGTSESFVFDGKKYLFEGDASSLVVYRLESPVVEKETNKEEENSDSDQERPSDVNRLKGQTTAGNGLFAKVGSFLFSKKVDAADSKQESVEAFAPTKKTVKPTAKTTAGKGAISPGLEELVTPKEERILLEDAQISEISQEFTKKLRAAKQKASDAILGGFNEMAKEKYWKEFVDNKLFAANVDGTKNEFYVRRKDDNAPYEFVEAKSLVADSQKIPLKVLDSLGAVLATTQKEFEQYVADRKFAEELKPILDNLAQCGDHDWSNRGEGRTNLGMIGVDESNKEYRIFRGGSDKPERTIIFKNGKVFEKIGNEAEKKVEPSRLNEFPSLAEAQSLVTTQKKYVSNLVGVVTKIVPLIGEERSVKLGETRFQIQADQYSRLNTGTNEEETLTIKTNAAGDPAIIGYSHSVGGKTRSKRFSVESINEMAEDAKAKEKAEITRCKGLIEGYFIEIEGIKKIGVQFPPEGKKGNLSRGGGYVFSGSGNTSARAVKAINLDGTSDGKVEVYDYIAAEEDLRVILGKAQVARDKAQVDRDIAGLNDSLKILEQSVYGKSSNGASYHIGGKYEISRKTEDGAEIITLKISENEKYELNLKTKDLTIGGKKITSALSGIQDVISLANESFEAANAALNQDKKTIHGQLVSLCKTLEEGPKTNAESPYREIEDELDVARQRNSERLKKEQQKERDDQYSSELNALKQRVVALKDFGQIELDNKTVLSVVADSVKIAGTEIPFAPRQNVTPENLAELQRLVGLTKKEGVDQVAQFVAIHQQFSPQISSGLKELSALTGKNEFSVANGGATITAKVVGEEARLSLHTKNNEIAPISSQSYQPVLDGLAKALEVERENKKLRDARAQVFAEVKEQGENASEGRAKTLEDSQNLRQAFLSIVCPSGDRTQEINFAGEKIYYDNENNIVTRKRNAGGDQEFTFAKNINLLVSFKNAGSAADELSNLNQEISEERRKKNAEIREQFEVVEEFGETGIGDEHKIGYDERKVTKNGISDSEPVFYVIKAEAVLREEIERLARNRLIAETKALLKERELLAKNFGDEANQFLGQVQGGYEIKTGLAAATKILPKSGSNDSFTQIGFFVLDDDLLVANGKTTREMYELAKSISDLKEEMAQKREELEKGVDERIADKSKQLEQIERKNPQISKDLGLTVTRDQEGKISDVGGEGIDPKQHPTLEKKIDFLLAEALKKIELDEAREDLKKAVRALFGDPERYGTKEYEHTFLDGSTLKYTDDKNWVFAVKDRETFTLQNDGLNNSDVAKIKGAVTSLGELMKAERKDLMRLAADLAKDKNALDLRHNTKYVHVKDKIISSVKEDLIELNDESFGLKEDSLSVTRGGKTSKEDLRAIAYLRNDLFVNATTTIKDQNSALDAADVLKNSMEQLRLLDEQIKEKDSKAKPNFVGGKITFKKSEIGGKLPTELAVIQNKERIEAIKDIGVNINKNGWRVAEIEQYQAAINQRIESAQKNLNDLNVAEKAEGLKPKLDKLKIKPNEDGFYDLGGDQIAFGAEGKITVKGKPGSNDVDPVVVERIQESADGLLTELSAKDKGSSVISKFFRRITENSKNTKEIKTALEEIKKTSVGDETTPYKLESKKAILGKDATLTVQNGENSSITLSIVSANFSYLITVSNGQLSLQKGDKSSKSSNEFKGVVSAAKTYFDTDKAELGRTTKSLGDDIANDVFSSDARKAKKYQCGKHTVTPESLTSKDQPSVKIKSFSDDLSALQLELQASRVALVSRAKEALTYLGQDLKELETKIPLIDLRDRCDELDRQVKRVKQTKFEQLETGFDEIFASGPSVKNADYSSAKKGEYGEYDVLLVQDAEGKNKKIKVIGEAKETVVILPASSEDKDLDNQLAALAEAQGQIRAKIIAKIAADAQKIAALNPENVTKSGDNFALTIGGKKYNLAGDQLSSDGDQVVTDLTKLRELRNALSQNLNSLNEERDLLTNSVLSQILTLRNGAMSGVEEVSDHQIGHSKIKETKGESAIRIEDQGQEYVANFSDQELPRFDGSEKLKDVFVTENHSLRKPTIPELKTFEQHLLALAEALNQQKEGLKVILNERQEELRELKSAAAIPEENAANDQSYAQINQAKSAVEASITAAWVEKVKEQAEKVQSIENDAKLKVKKEENGDFVIEIDSRKYKLSGDKLSDATGDLQYDQVSDIKQVRDDLVAALERSKIAKRQAKEKELFDLLQASYEDEFGGDVESRNNLIKRSGENEFAIYFKTAEGATREEKLSFTVDGFIDEKSATQFANDEEVLAKKAEFEKSRNDSRSRVAEEFTGKYYEFKDANEENKEYLESEDTTGPVGEKDFCVIGNIDGKEQNIFFDDEETDFLIEGGTGLTSLGQQTVLEGSKAVKIKTLESVDTTSISHATFFRFMEKLTAIKADASKDEEELRTSVEEKYQKLKDDLFGATTGEFAGIELGELNLKRTADNKVTAGNDLLDGELSKLDRQQLRGLSEKLVSAQQALDSKKSTLADNLFDAAKEFRTLIADSILQAAYESGDVKYDITDSEGDNEASFRLLNYSRSKTERNWTAKNEVSAKKDQKNTTTIVIASEESASSYLDLQRACEIVSALNQQELARLVQQKLDQLKDSAFGEHQAKGDEVLKISAKTSEEEGFTFENSTKTEFEITRTEGEKRELVNCENLQDLNTEELKALSSILDSAQRALDGKRKELSDQLFADAEEIKPRIGILNKDQATYEIEAGEGEFNEFTLKTPEQDTKCRRTKEGEIAEVTFATKKPTSSCQDIKDILDIISKHHAEVVVAEKEKNQKQQDAMKKVAEESQKAATEALDTAFKEASKVRINKLINEIADIAVGSVEEKSHKIPENGELPKLEISRGQKEGKQLVILKENDSEKDLSKMTMIELTAHLEEVTKFKSRFESNRSDLHKKLVADHKLVSDEKYQTYAAGLAEIAVPQSANLSNSLAIIELQEELSKVSKSIVGLILAEEKTKIEELAGKAYGNIRITKNGEEEEYSISGSDQNSPTKYLIKNGVICDPAGEEIKSPQKLAEIYQLKLDIDAAHAALEFDRLKNELNAQLEKVIATGEEGQVEIGGYKVKRSADGKVSVGDLSISDAVNANSAALKEIKEALSDEVLLAQRKAESVSLRSNFAKLIDGEDYELLTDRDSGTGFSKVSKPEGEGYENKYDLTKKDKTGDLVFDFDDSKGLQIEGQALQPSIFYIENLRKKFDQEIINRDSNTKEGALNKARKDLEQIAQDALGGDVDGNGYAIAGYKILRPEEKKIILMIGDEKLEYNTETKKFDPESDSIALRDRVEKAKTSFDKDRETLSEQFKGQAKTLKETVFGFDTEGDSPYTIGKFEVASSGNIKIHKRLLDANSSSKQLFADKSSLEDGIIQVNMAKNVLSRALEAAFNEIKGLKSYVTDFDVAENGFVLTAKDATKESFDIEFTAGSAAQIKKCKTSELESTQPRSDYQIIRQTKEQIEGIINKARDAKKLAEQQGAEKARDLFVAELDKLIGHLGGINMLNRDEFKNLGCELIKDSRYNLNLGGKNFEITLGDDEEVEKVKIGGKTLDELVTEDPKKFVEAVKEYSSSLEDKMAEAAGSLGVLQQRQNAAEKLFRTVNEKSESKNSYVDATSASAFAEFDRDNEGKVTAITDPTLQLKITFEEKYLRVTNLRTGSDVTSLKQNKDPSQFRAYGAEKLDLLTKRIDNYHQNMVRDSQEESGRSHAVSGQGTG